MKTKNENNACIDAMLWVGNDKHQWQTVGEFVKEAQLRGCCRKLPFVLGWMEFGKTKIFLAHRDRHKDKSKGSIFGYFVLHRIELITNNEVAHSLSGSMASDFLWPRDIKKYVSFIKRLKAEQFSQEEITRQLKEKLQHDHMFVIAKGKRPPEGPPYKQSEPDDDITEFIKKVFEYLLEKWLNPHNDKRFNGDCFPPEDSTYGEGHRGCSTRKGIGSAYAVDALCTSVHNSYQKLLRQYLLDKRRLGKSQKETLRILQEENLKSWENWFNNRRIDRWDVEELLEVYKGPFREAVKKGHDAWTIKYPIDPRLNGKASNCGELIVFNKPYLTLKKAPQASFEGLWHIDGDKLIEQIASHTRKQALIPTIYFCKANRRYDMQSQNIVTKQDFAARLAEELHVNKACATSLLDKISEKAREQLQQFQKFKLPGIGTIHLKTTRSGKKIVFSPHKPISSLETKVEKKD
jgi:nucleoid DNA-binding protein